jgi:arylformamidase
MTQIWDITVPYRTDLPLWPGDPAPSMTMMKCQEEGHRCNVTRLDAGVHFGTHLDAPVHFIDGGKGVDELDIHVLVGPSVVAEIPDVTEITPDHLAALDLPADTKRLLLKTKNSSLWEEPNHPFVTNFAALTADAARWVVESNIKLIGIDYLSIQLFADTDSTTHNVLLSDEVIIVEGLDLRAVMPGTYQLTCLPMKLVAADGAPVRAILTRE